MKKATFIAIIAALLLLVSCNVDSEHGIYYRVNTSQASSGINIVQSMGYENGKFYFLSDDGIRYTTEKAGDTAVIEETKGKVLHGAFKSGDVFYYLNSDGHLFVLEDGNETRICEEYEFKGLSSNGYVFSDLTVILLPTTTAEHGISLKTMPLSSKQSLLVMDDSNKADIYTNSVSDPITITGFTGYATGFTVAVGGSSYFVFDGKKVYEVSGSVTSLEDGRLVYSGLEAAPTGGYKAVHYYDEKADASYLLVRTSKGFTKINSVTGEVAGSSFLNDLNDVVVLDMYAIDGSSDVAIVTYANGIRIAKMADGTISDDIL